MTLVPVNTDTRLAVPARTRLDHALASSAAVIGTHLHLAYDRFYARDDEGMTTAEYAVGILAAVALAGVLLVVVQDASVKNAMLKILTGSLKG